MEPTIVIGIQMKVNSVNSSKALFTGSDTEIRYVKSFHIVSVVTVTLMGFQTHSTRQTHRCRYV